MSSLDGEKNFLLDNLGLDLRSRADVVKELNQLLDLGDLLSRARDELCQGTFLVGVGTDRHNAHLAIPGKTVADDLLEAAVQVGNCAFLVKLLDRNMEFLDKLVLLKSNVLATKLFDSQ